MTTQAPTSPDQDSPEVTSRPAKQWTTAQRLAILAEYEALPKGDARRGALLRRHRLSSSHIARWRSQRDRGTLDRLVLPQLSAMAKALLNYDAFQLRIIVQAWLREQPHFRLLPLEEYVAQCTDLANQL
ncbi:hypothetical protein [Candidatus Viridilinea mediisalina]|uniref:Transposase n=1 Tax=Candidatus Viridilinea mediisalina TaxID=2024553 RepID=A0A2A6RH84_9CHLR|nr:hypothetical protein [Candidatus Viridilinea mediisalina]PDW02427.1 hypothetical protein CJ255_13975 [Candidatus Viridilinea mediisalina]